MEQREEKSAGRAEGRHDGCANPYQLHSIWWSNSIDLRRGWSQRRQCLRDTLNDHLDHGRAT